MIDLKMEEPEDLLDLIDAQSGKKSAHCVEVYNFHEWLRTELRVREEYIPELLNKLERGEAILPKYDAVLIDEGQDFEPEWMRLVKSVLNPDTQSLLLAEDRAQAIFKRRSSLAHDTGLDFRGRSKILTINYRNTAQIVQFTWDFFQTHSQLQDKVRQGSIDGIEIIPPKSTKRKGPEPTVRRCSTFVEEMDHATAEIVRLHRDLQVPYEDMAILYRVQRTHRQSYIDWIRNKLGAAGVPYYWMAESSEAKRNFVRNDPSVKISTIDSAKGLDFRAVFLVNVDNMPFHLEEEEEREVSLLYIGMTRALEYLHLTYSGKSKFTDYLDEVAERRRSPKKDSKRMG